METIRILLVEDVERDAQLVLHELRRAELSEHRVRQAPQCGREALERSEETRGGLTVSRGRAPVLVHGQDTPGRGIATTR